MKAVRGVKQDAFDRFPAADDGLIGEVSVQLIEMPTSEALGAELPYQRVPVVFAVQDDLPVRPFDGDVGFHHRQGIAGRVPIDLHSANPCSCKVADGEIADKFLKNSRHGPLVVQNVPKVMVSGPGAVREVRTVDEFAKLKQKAIGPVVAVELDAPEAGTV